MMTFLNAQTIPTENVNICLTAAYWTTADNSRHYKSNLLTDEKRLRLSATFKLSFRTIYCRTNWTVSCLHLRWLTCGVEYYIYMRLWPMGVRNESKVTSVVCWQLATATTRTGQATSCYKIFNLFACSPRWSYSIYRMPTLMGDWACSLSIVSGLSVYF